ncbi:hypothetical protein FOCC_FOCC003435 [Frankliniella occidentalis]|nr:hypothetical protein FOCC_FOCC003435 [Frankliniella occidentalis]
MSWRHPDKAVLLHGAVRLSHTPFTVVEFATLLAMSSNSRAVELAAKLITCAVQEWSENIYVNTSYVTLLLTSNCRSLLSLETALECLGRARKLAPNSPLLSGYYWSLHDIQRAGGQLSPILEESAEDMIARGIGQWDAAKEARMRELAAQLYPGAAVVKTSTASQLLAAPPQEQPSPTLAGEDLSPAMRSPNLWGPAAPRRAPVRRSATPPLPSSKMTTPVTSPVTTPSTTPATSPSSSPPSGRRLRTQTQIGTLRMPLTKPAAPDAPSAAPDAPSAAPDAPSAAPAYRLSVPPPPPSLRERTAAPSPAPPAAAPSPAPPAAAPSPAPPAAAPSPAPPAAAPSTAAARITAAAQNIPWASWTSRSAPLTPPPTPSPPREGSLSEEADTVPLWRRPTGAGLTEVRSRWRTSPASMGSSALTIVMSESLATKSSSKVTSAPMAGKPAIVNCVCTSSCALLTYKSYGTLRPGASIPKLCSLK